METKLRQRIIGGIVLAALAIIFLPLFFKGSNSSAPSSSQVAISEQIPPHPDRPTPNMSEIQTTNEPMLSAEEKNKVVNISQQGDTLVASVSEVKPAPKPVEQTQVNIVPNTAPITESTPLAPVSQAITDEITMKPVAATKPKSDEASVSQSMNAAEEKVLATKPAPFFAKQATPVSKTKSSAVMPPKQKPKAITLGAWAVQLGSFEQEDHAKALVKQLQSHGFAAYLEKNKTAKGMMSRVLIGPETKRAKAEILITKLDKQLQIKGVVVPYEVKLFK